MAKTSQKTFDEVRESMKKAARRMKFFCKLALETIEVPSGGPGSLKINAANVEENQ